MPGLYELLCIALFLSLKKWYNLKEQNIFLKIMKKIISLFILLSPGYVFACASDGIFLNPENIAGTILAVILLVCWPITIIRFLKSEPKNKRRFIFIFAFLALLTIIAAVVWRASAYLIGC